MAFDSTKRHVVCESSYLSATYGNERILNLKTAADIDNGKLAAKGAYISPEIYQMETPAGTSKVYLTLQTPLIYESELKSYQAEYNFYNAKEDIVRCYPLRADDIFTVSVEGIEALTEGQPPVVGNLVVADGHNIKEAAAGTDAKALGFAGRIIEKAANGNYRIEVIKNQDAAN